MSEAIYQEAMEAILKGDVDKAADTAKKGIDTGMDPLDLMNNGFISKLLYLGRRRLVSYCFSTSTFFFELTITESGTLS